MTGDVCTCGLCEVDECDRCESPVAFIDDDGEAWCHACHDNYVTGLAEAHAERELASWHGGSAWPYTTRWEEPR